MQITVAERLRPFSLKPGIEFPLPRSTWSIKIYPAELCFRSLISDEERRVPLNVTGPIEQFAAFLDLEKEAVRVHFLTPSGRVRYWLAAFGELILIREKGEKLLEGEGFLKEVEHFDFPFRTVRERLSFGSSGKLNADKKLPLQALLPVWMRLGSLFGEGFESALSIGQAQLLLESAFRAFFVPDLKRPALFGLKKPPFSSPLALLKAGASLRELFLSEQEGLLSILPDLPALFPSGRISDAPFSLGSLGVEWRKGKLRRLQIFGKKEGRVQIALPQGVQAFRSAPEGSISPEGFLDIAPETEYLFDQFLC